MVDGNVVRHIYNLLILIIFSLEGSAWFCATELRPWLDPVSVTVEGVIGQFRVTQM